MGPRDGDGSRWHLASLDSLGDPDELRRQAEEELRREGVDRADRFEGADPTGSIRVVVDARSRVVSVDIDPQWKRRIGVDGFASALLSSYTAAVHESMTPAIHSALEAEAATESHREAFVPHPRAAESELGDEEWLRRTWATLHDIKAQLSRLEQADDAAQPDERTVSGPEGLVTLRLRGRGLAGIDADITRIALGDPDQLRFDALDAFRAAALAAEG